MSTESVGELVATTRVQVTVEIRDNGPYGDAWTIKDIEKDARVAAENILRNLETNTKGKIRAVLDSNKQLVFTTTIVRR